MVIYEIRNKINGKLYIGKYSRSMKKFNSYWGSGNLIKAAIEKYGVENFEKCILDTCTSKEELNEREKYWIEKKETIIKGYNLATGGDGGDMSKFINYTDFKSRKNKSIAAKNYWKSLTNDEKFERSQKVTGKNNGMYGKKGYWSGKRKSQELVRKCIENRRSYKGAENPNWKGGVEFKVCTNCSVNISKNNKSNTCNTCKDRSGKNNAFFWKTHTDESKQKMREARLGKRPSNIRKVEIDNVIYDSLKDASDVLNISNSLIVYRIKSDKEQYQNYKYL